MIPDDGIQAGTNREWTNGVEKDKIDKWKRR
jgi:uncharacterized protein YeaO (DUF488 family)